MTLKKLHLYNLRTKMEQWEANGSANRKQQTTPKRIQSTLERVQQYSID